MENHVDTMAVAAIIFGAGSELIALSPLRSNSWVQLLLQFGRVAFPPRRR